MNKYKHWLTARGKLLKKYALCIPDSPSSVHLKFDYPVCGWSNVHVLVNGEEKYKIDISDAYEPFTDIIEWLENIVRHIFSFTPSGVYIYDESDYALLYYEPIFYTYDEMLCSPPSSLCGIFYIYDTCQNKVVIDVFCDTKEFLNNIYFDILNYAKKASKVESFVDDWIVSAYNSEYSKFDVEEDPAIREIFIRKIKSKLIEDFLSNDNSTKRLIKIR